jgi:hypothetical protein
LPAERSDIRPDVKVVLPEVKPIGDIANLVA